MKSITLNGNDLTIEDVCKVAEENIPVELSSEKSFLETLKKSREFLLDYISKGLPTYGVTTGFGDSCDNQISPEKAAVFSCEGHSSDSQAR